MLLRYAHYARYARYSRYARYFTRARNLHIYAPPLA